MATLDEVLLTMSDSDVLHDRIQLIINEDLRTISIPSEGAILGVVGDKDINHVNFKMPSIYNGIDMSDFTIRIEYQLPNEQTGYYTVREKEVRDECLIFDWLISSNICKEPGMVTFSVYMLKVDDEGVISKAFRTIPSSGYILDRMEAEYEEVTETIRDEYLGMIVGYLNSHPEYVGATAEERTKINTIGDVSQLSTTEKSNLVAAINSFISGLPDEQIFDEYIMLGENPTPAEHTKIFVKTNKPQVEVPSIDALNKFRENFIKEGFSEEQFNQAITDYMNAHTDLFPNKESYEKINNTLLPKIPAGKVWGTTANGADWLDNVSESTVASWGFTKNKGTYIKPSTGIPESDLASAFTTKVKNKFGYAEIVDKHLYFYSDSTKKTLLSDIDITDLLYTKTESDEKYYTKTEVTENLYTKTEADEKYYAKTDVDTELGKKSPLYKKTDVTVLASGWTGNSAPYSNILTITGVTATNDIQILPSNTITADQVTAWTTAMVASASQAEDYIRLIAFGEKPSIDIPITILIGGEVT